MPRLFSRSALTVCLLASVCSSMLLSAQELAGSRPNIILIMTDDQGKGEVNVLGNKILKTPNMDNIYNQSVRFTAFQVSPTCAPTRSAIMTGRHEFMNGVTHTILERERMTLQATTLAQSLTTAGYATGIFGKWHLGDEDEYQPHKRGFQEAFIHGAGGIGQAYDSSCADAPPNQKSKYFDSVIRHNGSFVKTKGFCTDVFFKAATGWIKKCQTENKPFFAYIATNAPHGPMISPDSYKKRFLDLGYDDSSAARMGMIENIDDNLGMLMQKVSEWGLDKNTLIIFMTDNGQSYRKGKLNGKPVNLDFSGYKTGKGSPEEGGTCVPAFWRWKDTLPAGVDIPNLAGHIDIFPTLAALTKAQIPTDQIEGRSLVPLLANAQAPWDDRYLFTHVGRWGKGADPNTAKFSKCAVRNQRFRFVNNKELYDMQNDPFESTNVIEKFPDEVAAMRKAYDAWWARVMPMMVNEKVPNAKERPFWVWYDEQVKNGGIPDWVEPTF